MRERQKSLTAERLFEKNSVIFWFWSAEPRQTAPGDCRKSQT